MARIMAIDYGKKRTGIAVTDPLQIIATGLDTINSHELIPFLKEYISREAVELILIGMPLNLDETETHGTAPAKNAIERLKKAFPQIPIKTVDERYTSKMAVSAMHAMGMKKKERQVKGNIDVIAATIMLQEYMSTMF
jgi:putative Holliday junction resolvase